MNPRRTSSFAPTAFSFVVACLLVLVAAAGGCASRTAPLQREAVRLYDEGQYAEARDLLEQIAESGEASGALLYRLHYCQQATGDDRAPETLKRALERLEQELSTAAGLEVPFYLVNTYQNSGRAADARRVAQETTQRVESGQLAEPQSPVEMFRLGKLYADIGRSEPATTWYTRALAGFAEDVDEVNRHYVRWASRYLAGPAFQRRDFELAERYYSEISAADDASADDLERLAVARFRLGKYTEAAQAWSRATSIPSGDPDRTRYCARLALLAARIGVLPSESPDGRPWGLLSKDELQALMIEQAARARAAVAEARGPESLPDERMRQLRRELGQSHPLFVAAALEYAVRRYGIRETAFFGGFARMIFDKNEWRIRTRRK